METPPSRSATGAVLSNMGTAWVTVCLGDHQIDHLVLDPLLDLGQVGIDDDAVCLRERILGVLDLTETDMRFCLLAQRVDDETRTATARSLQGFRIQHERFIGIRLTQALGRHQQLAESGR